MGEIRSDAFSAYSSSNIKPRNITSDMWEPITTSGNYRAYVPERKTEESGQNSFAAKEPERSFEKAHTPEKKNTQQKSVPQKKKKKAQKPTPHREEMISNAVPKTHKRKKKSVSSSASAGPSFAEKMAKRYARSAARKRDRANKAFLRLVKSGKSVDEARIIITKRKLRKRKLGTFCSVAFLFFFAVLFLGIYTYCEGAEISDIVIDGDDVYTHSEILEAANLSEGMNMLTIREKNVNDSVTTTLPFISVVGVKYDLPDTLRLSIISTSERLIIKNAGKYVCIDKTGKVVSEKKKKLSKGQYIVVGLQEQDYTVGELFVPTEENKKKYEIACSVAFAADDNNVINTGTIDVSDIKDITLTYKSRLRVYLGSDDNLQSKLQKADNLTIDNKAQNKTGYINTKYVVASYYMQGSMDL